MRCRRLVCLSRHRRRRLLRLKCRGDRGGVGVLSSFCVIYRGTQDSGGVELFTVRVLSVGVLQVIHRITVLF